jgi:hypothetical protein
MKQKKRGMLRVAGFAVEDFVTVDGGGAVVDHPRPPGGLLPRTFGLPGNPRIDRFITRFSAGASNLMRQWNKTMRAAYYPAS